MADLVAGWVGGWVRKSQGGRGPETKKYLTLSHRRKLDGQRQRGRFSGECHDEK